MPSKQMWEGYKEATLQHVRELKNNHFAKRWNDQSKARLLKTQSSAACYNLLKFHALIQSHVHMTLN